MCGLIKKITKIFIKYKLTLIFINYVNLYHKKKTNLKVILTQINNIRSKKLKLGIRKLKYC